MRVLHIAAHVGGGIGAAYAGLGGCGIEQSIVLLEEPVDKASLLGVIKSGFTVHVCPGREELVQLLEISDIVLFSWTHHPALTKLMIEFPNIPIRSILWCHVSGNYFPTIRAGFLQLFDQCLFATPYSLELPEVRALGRSYVQDHFSVVYGLGDLVRYTKLTPRKHEGFVLGYVGTLNQCKLHPSFIGFIAAAIK